MLYSGQVANIQYNENNSVKENDTVSRKWDTKLQKIESKDSYTFKKQYAFALIK